MLLQDVGGNISEEALAQHLNKMPTPPLAPLTDLQMMYCLTLLAMQHLNDIPLF